jgi:hypothetical protein
MKYGSYAFDIGRLTLKLEVLDNLLVRSIRLLEIEHIHYAGTTNYNGNLIGQIRTRTLNKDQMSTQQ